MNVGKVIARCAYDCDHWLTSPTMHNVYEHFKSINNEPLCLVIKQTDQQLEIDLKLLISTTFRLLIKKIILTSFLIYLISYYFQFSYTFINFFLLVGLFIFIFRFCIQVVEESLLIQNEQGKIKYSYKYLIGLRRDKFISSRKIIINEGIIYNRVIFYLGVMQYDELTNEEVVSPLFCKLLPRLDCLKCIYTCIQKFDQ